jgi:hypothetical protein
MSGSRRNAPTNAECDCKKPRLTILIVRRSKYWQRVTASAAEQKTAKFVPPRLELGRPHP